MKLFYIFCLNMKKFLFSLIGIVLTTGFVGVTNAAVDVSDLFNGETPLVDDAYQKLLTDYDNTRWYSNTTITPNVTCSDVGELKVYSEVIEDSYFEDAPEYILIVSPYSMDKIRRWDSSIDYSKIIMKRNFVGNAPEGAVLDSIYFSISLDEIDLDSKYYWFIVPVDIYDEIWKPSNELELDMSNCFWTISIANPDNLSEWITILDRNLWATSNDITDGGSYGYYYQRWNNYWFNRYYPVNTTENFVEWDERYNNKWYYWEEFVKSYWCFTAENGDDLCYSARDYWSGESHDWLRWWENDDRSNGWWANETNYVGRQWPCPEWYHVPSAWEWWLLVKYWQKTYGNTTILSWWNGQYNFVGNAARQSFMNYFKLPLAWTMDSLDANMTMLGDEGMYWSSTAGSANSGYAEHLTIDSDDNPSSVYATAESPRIEGYSVRCFKNTYESEVKSTKITLKPWLNTFSTPAVLKSISFSNGWENISFAKMENGKWKALAINGGTFDKVIRPLEWFIIRNSNSEDVTMTIEYDTDIDINDALHQKQLDAWRNFLGITKTNNPFGSIANAMAMDIIDFTAWNSNKIDLSKLRDATSFMLWKAYGVFVNNSNWIYGWRNNQEGLGDLVDCDDVAIQLACSIGSGYCPNNCNYSIQWNLEWNSDYNRSDDLFVEWRTSAKVLFKWTYTAEWWDIYLDKFTFIDKNLNTFQWGFEWRFIIYIDWNRQELNLNGLWKWFVNVELDNIVKVEDGESVSIDITFTQDWYRNKVNENAKWDCSYINQYILKLSGTDDYDRRIQSNTAETSPIYYSTQTQAELKNNLESTVTFSEWWASKVVFSGTYKAEIGDLSINSFNVKVWNPENCSENTDINWGILFHLYVDWEEVETSAWMLIDRCTTEATVYFDEINVNNWESVSIKIIWEFLWNISTWQHNYMVTLTHTDSCFERLFTETKEWMAPIKIVDSSNELSVQAMSGKNTVLLNEHNAVLWRFMVLPTNSTQWYFDNLVLKVTNPAWSTLDYDDIELRIDWTEIDEWDWQSSDWRLWYEDLDKLVDSLWSEVEVSIKNPDDWEYVLDIIDINTVWTSHFGKDPIITFNKRFESALVYIESQRNEDDKTHYILWVDKYDDSDVIQNLRLFTWYDVEQNECVGSLSFDKLSWESFYFEDWDEIVINNGNDAQLIKCIEYIVVYDGQECVDLDENNNCNEYMPVMQIRSRVSINKNDYLDYFKTRTWGFRKVFGRDSAGNGVCWNWVVDDWENCSNCPVDLGDICNTN